MPGRRPLTPDRLAEIALDADAGNLAIALSKRQVTEQQAVAQLALDAPCRPDLINSVATDIERCRATRLADWPPAETTVMLLRRAQQVTLGRVKLVGRDGVSVEQVTLTGKQGGPPIRYLQLRHHGQHVGDYRTVEELARHIDLATLVEELPPPEHRRQRAGAGARLPSSGCRAHRHCARMRIHRWSANLHAQVVWRVCRTTNDRSPAAHVGGPPAR